jgi:hypothetical protein
VLLARKKCNQFPQGLRLIGTAQSNENDLPAIHKTCRWETRKLAASKGQQGASNNLVSNSQQTRIFEVDADPPFLPSEVARLLSPLLGEQRLAATNAGTTIRSGESFDAEFPSTHSSYFVLVRFRSGDEASRAAADKAIQAITEFCNTNRLPIIEIHENHPEYQQYLLEPAFE